MRVKVVTVMRWYVQDEVNQDYSEQNEVDGMKKGADSTGKVMHMWKFRLSVLMDSDLAWVNGKSGWHRQSWCYADAFQRSIISGAIYHLFFAM